MGSGRGVWGEAVVALAREGVGDAKRPLLDLKSMILGHTAGPKESHKSEKGANRQAEPAPSWEG